MVKAEYWDVDDAQLIEKTGHPLVHWTGLLDGFAAGARKSNESGAFLQESHGVPRYWARTLTTRYLKDREG